jgi:hypothetical protein
MRIGDYVVRSDANYWIVATIKTFVTGRTRVGRHLAGRTDRAEADRRRWLT